MPGSDEMERFASLLSAKGLKVPMERRQLLDEVLLQKKHFDADSLYETVRRKGLRISRDTVYRTMPLLLECGVLQKSVGDGRREYFERTAAKGHHDHMVCIGCGRVIEFACEPLEKMQEKLAQEHGFRLIFHDHRLFGYCRECQRTAGKRLP